MITIAKATITTLIMLWFWGGMLFGHSCAKYARSKQESRLLGCTLIIVALVATLYALRGGE